MASDLLCQVCGGYYFPEYHRRCDEERKKRALLQLSEQQATEDPMREPDEWHPVHELNIWTHDLEDIMAGKRTFDIRYNSQNFRAGDFLWLREEDPDSNTILTRSILVEVNHTTEGMLRGLDPDYIIMSLGKWRPQEGLPPHLKEKS